MKLERLNYAGGSTTTSPIPKVEDVEDEPLLKKAGSKSQGRYMLPKEEQEMV